MVPARWHYVKWHLLEGANTITSRVGLSADHRTLRQVVAVAGEISQRGGDVRSNAASVDREQWPV